MSDEGREVEFYGKTYKWTFKEGRWTLVRVPDTSDN